MRYVFLFTLLAVAASASAQDRLILLEDPIGGAVVGRISTDTTATTVQVVLSNGQDEISRTLTVSDGVAYFAIDTTMRAGGLVYAYLVEDDDRATSVSLGTIQMHDAVSYLSGQHIQDILAEMDAAATEAGLTMQQKEAVLEIMRTAGWRLYVRRLLNLQRQGTEIERALGTLQ